MIMPASFVLTSARKVRPDGEGDRDLAGEADEKLKRKNNGKIVERT